MGDAVVGYKANGQLADDAAFGNGPRPERCNLGGMSDRAANSKVVDTHCKYATRPRLDVDARKQQLSCVWRERAARQGQGLERQVPCASLAVEMFGNVQKQLVGKCEQHAATV